VKGRCVLGALIVFAAGAYWGLSQAAEAAKAAGCPASQDPAAKAAGVKRGERLGHPWQHGTERESGNDGSA